MRSFKPLLGAVLSICLAASCAQRARGVIRPSFQFIVVGKSGRPIPRAPIWLFDHVPRRMKPIEKLICVTDSKGSCAGALNYSYETSLLFYQRPDSSLEHRFEVVVGDASATNRFRTYLSGLEPRHLYSYLVIRATIVVDD